MNTYQTPITSARIICLAIRPPTVSGPESQPGVKVRPFEQNDDRLCAHVVANTFQGGDDVAVTPAANRYRP